MPSQIREGLDWETAKLKLHLHMMWIRDSSGNQFAGFIQ